ncbi:hypothetical protein DFJ67_0766 [Asanoa ferruginea]|uniref:Uncharacterized protein n=1 Tax=Asanoa ferruginea TaxID=53367 RepID=A0A3D9ZEC9_9ACTN|nr:PE domain-containing protein [Asanoa ferruginea]REF94822.1 hypothetical protein DFJ67_0766 [Asanoa ferruginea]GIF45600.1 hypothetical protein Afe04nite_01390 [Asanoa ferruginea]
MSSPGFHVDPQALGVSGASLERVGTEFATALRAFQSELAGFGAPWGSDEIGSLIGAAHEEVASWAFECFSAAASEVAAAGVDLGGMAAGYREVEEQIRGAFEAFGG